jgi:hypothetical protein
LINYNLSAGIKHDTPKTITLLFFGARYEPLFFFSLPKRRNVQKKAQNLMWPRYLRGWRGCPGETCASSYAAAHPYAFWRTYAFLGNQGQVTSAQSLSLSSGPEVNCGF